MTRIFAWLRRAYFLRQTRIELSALSDRMLSDIGLRRDEIDAELKTRTPQLAPGRRLR